MSAAQQTGIELLRFPCVPWKVRGETLAPIPGTWTLAPEALCMQGVKGIIACPNRECQQAALIRFDMGSLDNGALQLDRFQCAGCGFVCNARLSDWDKRKLFCCVYEFLDANGVATEQKKEYLHAENRGEAFLFFSNSVGYELDARKQRWRMVDCALAIGYFGQEKTDKDLLNLTVD